MERQNRDLYELWLSRAHRALFEASVAAETMNLWSEMNDCMDLSLEVHRLSEDSVKKRLGPAIRGKSAVRYPRE